MTHGFIGNKIADKFIEKLAQSTQKKGSSSSFPFSSLPFLSPLPSPLFSPPLSLLVPFVPSPSPPLPSSLLPFPPKTFCSKFLWTILQLGN